MGAKFLRMGLVFFLLAVLGLITSAVRAAPNAPPVNDDFVNATVITGDTGVQVGTLIAATKEAGEPQHAGNVGGASIWYKWVAPSTGAVAFYFSGNGFDTLLAIYTGVNLNALVPIAGNDNCGVYRDSCIVLNATGGTTYWLAGDGYNGGAGAATLRWVVPPENDNFANSELISGAPGSINGYSLNATVEDAEPSHGGQFDGGTVWYEWVAPADMEVRFSAYQGGQAGLLGIYIGNDVTQLTKVGTNPACGYYSYTDLCVRFHAVGGTTYFVAVAFPQWTSSPFSLRWGETPPNDDFETASVIQGATGSVSSSNVFATAQPGEPANDGRDARGSLWYQWVAPADGWMRLDTTGTNATTRIGLYTGSHIEELSVVPSINYCLDYPDACRRFYAQSGVVYRIAVEGSAEINLILNWRPLVRPSNDDFANQAELIGISGEVTGTTIDATRELGEPNHGSNYGAGSVWYEWTAPQNGRARVDVTSSFENGFGVYTGETLETLTALGTTSYLPYLTFDIVNGTTYHIAVDGEDSTDFGNLTLRWNCPVTDKPNSLTPRKGTTLSKTFVVLHWDSTYCASSYGLTVRQDSKKGLVIVREESLDSISYRVKGLLRGHTYFWQVKACSLVQCKASAWQKFTIK